MAHRIRRWALIEKETIMSNNTDVIFDPAIHATDADGNPVMRKDGSFSLKRGRKAGSTVTPGAGSFDVDAVTGAYLARVMAAGDLTALTAFTALGKGQRVAFLRTTPEYAERVTAKVVEDAVAKINAILDAAGTENYSAILDRVRFGA